MGGHFVAPHSAYKKGIPRRQPGDPLFPKKILLLGIKRQLNPLQHIL